MSEKLEIFDLEDNLVGVEDRDSFYSEIKKEFNSTGLISRKVKTVRIILMNSSGRIYLQKRSKFKSQNPGLYDKTIGGHVSAGDSFNITVIKECAEELGFPATILSDKEFKKSISIIDLSIVGLFRKVGHIKKFMSKRILSNKIDLFIQPQITNVYIGYYNGPIKLVDGESSGVETFSLNELKDEIKNKPDKFTNDIRLLIDKYDDFLVPVS